MTWRPFRTLGSRPTEFLWEWWCSANWSRHVKAIVSARKHTYCNALYFIIHHSEYIPSSVIYIIFLGCPKIFGDFVYLEMWVINVSPCQAMAPADKAAKDLRRHMSRCLIWSAASVKVVKEIYMNLYEFMVSRHKDLSFRDFPLWILGVSSWTWVFDDFETTSFSLSLALGGDSVLSGPGSGAQLIQTSNIKTRYQSYKAWGMRHGVGQSHNNSDIIFDIFCIPKVPMSKRHLTSELQCVDRTWKWQMQGARCNLGSRKTHWENTRRLRENQCVSGACQPFPLWVQPTPAAHGSEIWEGPVKVNVFVSRKNLFGQPEVFFCWKVSAGMWHIRIVFSCVAITAMVISWQYWHWQLRIFQSRTHSSILTLARALSWRALLSIQWISTYRGTSCFAWFLGVSERWWLTVAVQKLIEIWRQWF